MTVSDAYFTLVIDYVFSKQLSILELNVNEQLNYGLV